MKKALVWAKANLLLVALGVLVLLSLGVIGAVAFWWGPDFITEEQAFARTAGQLQSLRQTLVKIPPEKPDGKPREYRITVNQAAIDDLKDVQDKMQAEYLKVFGEADKINRPPYRPMCAGLFPEPLEASRPFYAKRAYLETISALLAPPRERNLPADLARDLAHLPCLYGGHPPTPEDVAKVLAAAQRQFLVQENPLRRPAVEQLSPNERARLGEFLRKRMVENLETQARRIHIYVQTEPTAPDFPFTLPEWSKGTVSEKPTPEQMWEGQMNLWVTQCIVQAIAQTNLATDSRMSVLSAPIKRLLRLDVYPGSVGLEQLGAMSDFNTAAAVADGRDGRGPANLLVPAVPSTAVMANVNPSAKLLDDFAVAPTGRKSNALYDVRHARLVMIADIQKIHEFYESLAAVNFMTVLSVRVTDIDEYDALHEGYVYGPDDMARVEMLIETIWLREWTTRLMPEAVKAKLGLAPAAGTPVAPVTPAPGGPGRPR